MEINIIQAFLIGFLYFLCQSGTPWLGSAFIANYCRQPVVNGFIVGLILGHPVEGLIIGSAINLPFIGVILVGGTMPTDAALAGIVGTAFALASNASAAVAVAMAVPIGLLGNILLTTHMTKNSIFVHMMDQAAEEGNVKKMNSLNVWWPQITTMLLMTIPVMLVVYFGSDAAASVIQSLSGKPLQIITVIGGVLPAVGIALTLRMLLNKKATFLFYLLGLLMVSYFKLPMITIALFGIIIAYFYTELLMKKVED